MSDIEQVFTQPLYTEGAETITKKVLTEVKRFNQKFDGSASWREQLLRALDTFEGLSKGLTVIKAALLAILEDHWQELDQEWRNQYNDDFEVFVFRRCGRRPGTIRADLRAVRLFLFDDTARPFGTVEMPVRTVDGSIAKDDRGKLITERVEWDLTATTLPKLKAAVPLAKRGKMTPQLWSMMMDDKVSSSDMIEKIYSVTPDPEKVGIRFKLMGPVLLGENEGIEVELGELDFSEYYEDPYSMKRKIMDRLLLLLDISLDEHVTLYKDKREAVHGYYNDIEGITTETETRLLPDSSRIV